MRHISLGYTLTYLCKPRIDQPAQLRCEDCTDVYCEVCYAAQHRKGSRKSHKSVPLKNDNGALQKGHKQHTHKQNQQNATASSSSTNGAVSKVLSVIIKHRHASRSGSGSQATDDTSSTSASSEQSMDEDEDENYIPQTTFVMGAQPAIGESVGDWFVERAKYLPLRLMLSERKYLRLLEAALQVSEYTDKIDVMGFSMAKNKRIVHQIRELCAILSGLVLSADYKQVAYTFSRLLSLFLCTDGLLMYSSSRDKNCSLTVTLKGTPSSIKKYLNSGDAIRS